MAADVEIHELIDSATNGTDKTGGTVRFKSAHSQTVDTNNRLQIPASGSATNHSFTKQLRTYFRTAPSVDIQNMEVYSDGSNNFGTGISVTYDKQTGWQSPTASDIGGSNFFSLTSGSPLTISSGALTSTGYKGGIVRLQMHVIDTASPGQLSTERFTLAYDET